MHAHQIHARQIHAYEAMPMKCMPYETHAHEVIAGEPEMKSVVKDIIKEVGSGGEVDSRVYPG
jgi:hypothetical protein